MERIKDPFEDHVIFKHPNFYRNFVIRCDASVWGIAAILGQKDGQGRDGIVGLLSCNLKKYDKSYSTTELVQGLFILRPPSSVIPT